MDAAYVFRVRFRLDPQGVRPDPAEFETVVERPAPTPGEDGWRLFREWLWRGELNDEPRFREVAGDWLGVPVVAASFSELRTDRAYLDALREAIEADLDTFNADDAEEVLHKYLGSSIHVRGP